MTFKRPITEQDIAAAVLTGQLDFPPIQWSARHPPPRKRRDGKTVCEDLILDARWDGGSARFIAEIRSLSTPKEFDIATRMAEAYAEDSGALPMVIVPYLRESQLRELEARTISGIDLCGNGVVVVPGRLTVFRTGQPNRFPSSAPIKKIYQRNSAMVGRSFLTMPAYPNVRAVCQAVNAANLLVRTGECTPMREATAWKVLKVLQDDLIVERSEDGFRLLQADKLLDNLAENFDRPRPVTEVRLKIDTGGKNLAQWFADCVMTVSSGWIATGLSSVNRYAVMAREEILSVYCTQFDAVRALVGGKERDRFPNLELIGVAEEPPYFDARQDGNVRWASPVQCFLELMAGDKRDQETADQVRAYILNRVGDRR